MISLLSLDVPPNLAMRNKHRHFFGLSAELASATSKLMKTHEIPNADRLIVALDVPTIAEAHDLVIKLSPVVNTFKIGYWLLFEPALSTLIPVLRDKQKQFFLDAKLNDIPETVEHGVGSAARWGANFITVHSDEAMLHAAMRGKGDSNIQVMAITALTSLPSAASRDRFRAGVINAMIADCDGLIMSPADLTDTIGRGVAGSIRQMVSNMIIATPGVRLDGETMHDHGRVGSPSQAVRNGADYLIVGRPIIRAIDPLAEAERFITQMG